MLVLWPSDVPSQSDSFSLYSKVSCNEIENVVCSSCSGRHFLLCVDTRRAVGGSRRLDMCKMPRNRIAVPSPLSGEAGINPRVFGVGLSADEVWGESLCGILQICGEVRRRWQPVCGNIPGRRSAPRLRIFVQSHNCKTLGALPSKSRTRK